MIALHNRVGAIESRVPTGVVTIAIGVVFLATGACRGPTPVLKRNLLEPLSTSMARPPTRSDLAAAYLATAALAAGPADTSSQMGDALAELEEAEAERLHFERRARGEPEREQAAKRSARPKGPLTPRKLPEPTLVPLARDVVNATLDDDIAYRRATRELLLSSAPDPSLRERLEEVVKDDPLQLAERRTWDSREREFARTFNAVSEPLGQALMAGLIMAPYNLALSAGHWVAGFFERDELDLQHRQALAHRERFLAQYPDDPRAEQVRKSVERDQAKLRETFRDRDMAAAERAWDGDQPRLAQALAARALARVPDDEDAAKLETEANAAVAHLRQNLARSLESQVAPLPDVESAFAADLARRMLLPREDIAPPARALLAANQRGPLTDEARFAVALAELEAGREEVGWRSMRRLANAKPSRSNMARHAGALAASSWQNPYRHFVELRRSGSQKSVASIFLGPYANGRRYKRIPAPIAWVLEAPAVVQAIATTPFRILFMPWGARPDFQRPTRVAAYRYLDVYPRGEHSREVFTWLTEYETDRENWSAALRLADFQPGFDTEKRQQLVEKAAETRLAQATRSPRRDVRASILRDVVREYPDAESGRLAGLEARSDVENSSIQRIRMTRGFLEENPRIAGPQGLGLRDALLDGQLANGELHPEGVTFLGGRWLEFHLVDRSGDDDEPPVKVRREVSVERLARTVVLVDEVTQRNSRLDPDDELGSDAQRDSYFERARLGLVDDIDSRPSAESTYVFEGVRERYGMVRGRDSILPFDLVLQGSFDTMGLAAFPRWRYPKETPDAFLYR